MIFRPTGRRYYIVKFTFHGRVIQKRTRATNSKVARQIEAMLRSELARGNWDVLKPQRQPAPQEAPLSLEQFLERQFLPHVDSTAAKRATRLYYHTGAKAVSEMTFAKLPLAEVTGKHAGQFAARHKQWSPSTVNCGLRTLRRALNLAEEWGLLPRAPKIKLAPGERQRDRVLTDTEIAAYLEASPQPWRDIATLMLAEGCRPGELYTLRWEQVALDPQPGFLHMRRTKSKASSRLLPLLPAARDALLRRWAEQGRPTEGWVFQSARDATRHISQGSAKTQHSRALRLSEVEPFCPYTSRHTGLTRLGESGCDAFTLARIAGHSSIMITQRYVHPQAEAVQRAFDRLAQQPGALGLPSPAAPIPPKKASA